VNVGCQLRPFLRRHDVIKQVLRAAVVVATALALSGCGGAEAEKAKPSAAPVSTPARGDVGGTPSAQNADGRVDATFTGAWASVLDGPPVVLHIEGSRVELLGESRCRGTLSKQNGRHVITLTRDHGNNDRTLGSSATADNAATAATTPSRPSPACTTSPSPHDRSASNAVPTCLITAFRNTL
jgi:hypothetical protein